MYPVQQQNLPHVQIDPPGQENSSLLTRIGNVVLLLLGSLLGFAFLPWQAAAAISSLAALAGIVYAIWPCCSSQNNGQMNAAQPPPHNPGPPQARIINFGMPFMQQSPMQNQPSLQRQAVHQLLAREQVDPKSNYPKNHQVLPRNPYPRYFHLRESVDGLNSTPGILSPPISSIGQPHRYSSGTTATDKAPPPTPRVSHKSLLTFTTRRNQ